MKSGLSQNRARAGAAAEFLTFFAVVWDAIVLALLIPTSGIPLWFKTIFFIIGVGVTWATVYQWRQRFKGGSVNMTLAQDPVPLGVPVIVEFQADRSINADKLLVEAKIESSARNESEFELNWCQDFAASQTEDRRIRAEVTLPNDYPNTESSEGDRAFRVTLSLKARGLVWAFDVKTRSASADEVQFVSRNASSLGNKKTILTPIQAAAARKQLTPWVAGFLVLIVLMQFSFSFDHQLWERTKALFGANAYSTAVHTKEFDIRVTNYLINDWALRGRLVGKARVVDGNLIVRVESLMVQPVGACAEEGRGCEVESVSLLLSQDGDKSFSTLAQSNLIAVNANLKEVARWSLPQAQIGTELSMSLPAVIEADGVRLKMEIRTADDATVYPDNGPYLNLQRALATAAEVSDPCKGLTGNLDLVRAGCTERLRSALNHTDGLGGALHRTWVGVLNRTRDIATNIGFGASVLPARETPDELLLEALRTENAEIAELLLASGASPNAQSPDDAGHTALGYAAASNDVAMVERLLAAGANVNARSANELGQVLTPLTQALRTDAAEAVHRLLQSGATTSTNDPTGWTPMHIAAYESAVGSVQELVSAGADINERTPAYRQQTPLQTAVQFGSAEMIRTLVQLGADRLIKDNEGKDACSWAQFFKRSKEIQSTVCL